LLAVALLGAAWVSQALALLPFATAARLEPGYGGMCEACVLSGRIMAGAHMTKSVFNRADFSNAVLARANASGSWFEAANFTSADLSHARLIDAHCRLAVFDGATLAQVDARRANFRRARFDRADVTGVNFAGADISGADLRTAEGLTQAQLATACGDRRTRLPPGMRVPACLRSR